LVSDPGYKLVRAALDTGYAVSAVPGASAVLAALTVSGLPTDAFQFAGFLAPKATARRAQLSALTAIPATLVLFEAPGRVVDLVADIAAVMGATRHVVLARELTKLHETVRSGPAGALAETLASEAVRGECVVLIAPAETTAAADVADPAAIDAALHDALQTASASAAAKLVGERFNRPKADMYARILALRSQAPS
jgi:16S rRNA (cytidine1402-2'-O)-methyltransferase